MSALTNPKPSGKDQRDDKMDKLTEAKRLIDEVNRELPSGFNFEFSVVELPIARTGTDGQPYWQAFEDQFVRINRENACVDSDELSPIDIADGLGAALIAAARWSDAR